MDEQTNLHLLSDKPIYNAKAVTLQTGITPATLRAWERRYGVLLPDRTSGGHRLYSERDIASLKWLKQQLDQGLTIGRASEILKDMLSAGPVATTAVGPVVTRSLGMIVDELYDALVSYNETLAESIMSEAYALYPIERVCTDVIQIVLRRIGDQWHDGRIQVATEHFVSNYLHRKIMALLDTGQSTRSGTIVVACAPTELHEVGILLMAIFLRRRGWRVVYLGQSVPLYDLPFALAFIRPDVLAFSSTLTNSAQELFGIESMLEQVDPRYRPQLAFGGPAFNDQIELREKVHGTFLGETIQSGVDTIEKLMAERKK